MDCFSCGVVPQYTAAQNSAKVYCEKRFIPLTHITPHLHPDCWEIVLQLAGEYMADIGGTSYHIRPGDILVIPPNVLHSGEAITPFRDTYLRIPSLDFSGFMLLHDDDGSVKTVLHLLHKVQTEQEYLFKEIGERLTDTVVSYITKLAGTERKYDFVYHVKNMIYENLSNSDFSIPDAVKELGFHPDYFRRCFKEEFSVAPQVYMANLRMAQAKKLLEQASFYSIAEIAERCGFKDSFYFSKCFKKHTGMSPQEYKKANRI